MPSVKVTELIEMLERKITELKAGDPSWNAAQKRRAKDTVEMFKAFKVLSAQQCTDTMQSLPGGGDSPAAPAAKKRKSSRKR